MPAAAPSRERRKRHDGTDIDPVKNLAEFLEGIPSSSDGPEPEEDPAAPAPQPAPVQLQVPTGPTPAEVIAEERGKRETAERELASLRSQSQIDEAARRAVAEQQQRAQARPPEPPPADPRITEIQDKWFTDPERAQQLLQSVNEDRTRQLLAAERGKWKDEIRSENDTAQRRAQGDYAFSESRRRLLEAGVSQADLDNHFKITGLYTAVTLPPTAQRANPYYSSGGPLSAEVLVQAWKDLYGMPAAQAPAPQFTPPPPVVAPPGSSRPAPAAEPPKRERAASVSQADQRDITYLAEALGHKPENLINRRRARLEREKGNQ